MKTILIQNGPRLDDKQIKEIFSVDASTGWFRAILQILDDARVERMVAAAGFGQENNEIGLKMAVGAVDHCTALIMQLVALRGGA